MAEDVSGSIVLAVIATIIALILGIIIGLFLNFDWLSFPIAVLIVAIGLGLLSDDFISAGIAGAITGFLTAFLKGFVISIFWGGWAATILNYFIGGQYLLLIFVGVIFAAGTNMFLSGKG